MHYTVLYVPYMEQALNIPKYYEIKTVYSRKYKRTINLKMLQYY